MGRRPCCDKKEGLNRGAWTAMEDKLLTDHIKLHGEGRWRSLPKKAGLKRCGKSCRLRWLNYLRPDIKRGNISDDEEELIVRLHKLLGNRWSLIAGRLPGRTDNEIKNYWNTNLSKKIIRDDRDSRGSKSSTTEVITPKLQPRSPDSSVVFRTKAYKCTRVFITSPPPPLPPPPPPHPLCTQKQDYAEAPECSKCVENSDPIMDLTTMDLDMSFDEFFNSQQLPLSDNNICSELIPDTINGGDHHSSPWPWSEMPSGIFSEEMMEGWTGNDCAFDASLLDTWLGV